jgi:hypothetical protein
MRAGNIMRGREPIMTMGVGVEVGEEAALDSSSLIGPLISFFVRSTSINEITASRIISFLPGLSFFISYNTLLLLSRKRRNSFKSPSGRGISTCSKFCCFVFGHAVIKGRPDMYYRLVSAQHY